MICLRCMFYHSVARDNSSIDWGTLCYHCSLFEVNYDYPHILIAHLLYFFYNFQIAESVVLAVRVVLNKEEIFS